MDKMDDDVSVLVTLENHTIRLNSIEAQIKQLNAISTSIQNLTLSVNKLAINMENMLAEQKDQGDRIKVLENTPAQSWTSAKRTAFTTIVSTFAGAFAVGIILLIAQYI